MPNYAKAWGRLATAGMGLSNWEAWQKALTCLPPEDEMTPEHNALKAQFDAGLTKAKDELVATRRMMSSAFVIMNAYREFPPLKGLRVTIHCRTSARASKS